MKKLVFLALAAALAGGCASYRWTRSVPDDMRTVSVPTFRNSSDVTELGSLATRQLLREFEREGTFKIASADEAALEIQGEIKSASAPSLGMSRRTPNRAGAYRLTVNAVITVIDRRTGRVLFTNRSYTGEGDFAITQDIMTGQRNASGRAAEDLARQIVDDLVSGRGLLKEKKQ